METGARYRSEVPAHTVEGQVGERTSAQVYPPAESTELGETALTDSYLSPISMEEKSRETSLPGDCVMGAGEISPRGL